MPYPAPPRPSTSWAKSTRIESTAEKVRFATPSMTARVNRVLRDGERVVLGGIVELSGGAIVRRVRPFPLDGAEERLFVQTSS